LGKNSFFSGFRPEQRGFFLLAEAGETLMGGLEKAVAALENACSAGRPGGEEDVFSLL